MYAPSYERTVKPFSDAHQRACKVLAELQHRGFEEAMKGDWRELIGKETVQ